MRGKLQGIAMMVMLGLALIADGAMEAWGEVTFTIVYAVGLGLCGLAIVVGDRLPEKKNRPRRCDLRERGDQPRKG